MLNRITHLEIMPQIIDKMDLWSDIPTNVEQDNALRNHASDY